MIEVVNVFVEAISQTTVSKTPPCHQAPVWRNRLRHTCFVMLSLPAVSFECVRMASLGICALIFMHPAAALCIIPY